LPSPLPRCGFPTAVTSQWGIYFSSNLLPTLYAQNTFVFPAPPASVHYVLCRAIEPGRGRVRFHYRIDGNAQFVSTQENGRAQVTLIIQRNDDDLSAVKASYRFWYLPGRRSRLETSLVTAPLDSSSKQHALTSPCAGNNPSWGRCAAEPRKRPWTGLLPPWSGFRFPTSPFPRRLKAGEWFSRRYVANRLHSVRQCGSGSQKAEPISERNPG
jgi:hypothetical protein